MRLEPFNMIITEVLYFFFSYLNIYILLMQENYLQKIYITSLSWNISTSESRNIKPYFWKKYFFTNVCPKIIKWINHTTELQLRSCLQKVSRAIFLKVWRLYSLLTCIRPQLLKVFRITSNFWQTISLLQCWLIFSQTYYRNSFIEKFIVQSSAIVKHHAATQLNKSMAKLST